MSFKGNDLDTTNFESAGLGEGILGVQICDISGGGDWDASKPPLTDPPGLYPRDDLPNVLLWTNINDFTFWDFPYMRVRQANNGTDVNGKVSFDFSGHSQGAFNLP